MVGAYVAKRHSDTHMMLSEIHFGDKVMENLFSVFNTTTCMFT